MGIDFDLTISLSTVISVLAGIVSFTAAFVAVKAAITRIEQRQLLTDTVVREHDLRIRLTENALSGLTERVHATYQGVLRIEDRLPK